MRKGEEERREGKRRDEKEREGTRREEKGREGQDLILFTQCVHSVCSLYCVGVGVGVGVVGEVSF